MARSGPGAVIGRSSRNAPAAVRPRHSRGDVQQRAFSAAAGPDDDDKFARLAIQRDVFNRRDIGIAKSLADAGQAQLSRARSCRRFFCTVAEEHSNPRFTAASSPARWRACVIISVSNRPVKVRSGIDEFQIVRPLLHRRKSLRQRIIREFRPSQRIPHHGRRKFFASQRHSASLS